MKALIAATCVAVLAAVGHYFWKEYRASQIAADEAEYHRARIERENEARYGPWRGYFDGATKTEETTKNQ